MTKVNNDINDSCMDTELQMTMLLTCRVQN